MLWTSFQASVAEREKLSQLYARMFESSLTRMVEAVENNLYAILQDIALEDDLNDLSVYQRRIGNLIRFAPHIRQVVLLKNGDTVYDSNTRSAGPVDFDRISFNKNVQNTLSLGINIGETLNGRFLPEKGQPPEMRSHRQLIPLYLEGVTDDDQTTYGVLVGLNAHYLKRMFRNTDLSDQDHYYLLRADGKQLLSKDRALNHDQILSAAVNSFQQGRDEYNLQRRNGLWPLSKTTIRLSAKYPLAVAVSVNHGATFDVWFSENRTLIIALCGTTFAVLFIAFWLYMDLQRSKLLRKEVQLLSSAVHQSPVSFLITDRDGRIEYANPTFEKIYGYTRDEYYHQRPSIIKSGQTDERLYKILWATLNKGRPWHGEFVNKTKDGTLIPTSTAISPVINEDGSCDYLVGAMLDISEQKVLQEKALQASHEARLASEAKSNFLATMSHELRTPMTGMQGIIELLKSEDCTVRQQHELLEDLEKSSSALMMLLNDILDLSKIEAGKLEVETAACNPSEIVRNVVHLFKESAFGKDVALTSNARVHANTWVKTDALRLRQIVSNLVSNAIKFTEEGRVKVEMQITPLAPGKVMVQIAVKDTGIGLSPDQLDHVFDPFTQADTSTTRKYGGTGLGLTITRQLCHLLGGRLKAQSELGAGSSFIVEIPMDAAPVPQQTDCQPQEVKSLKILLAEDNPINQKVVSTLLRKKGHVVEIAANGREAVEKVGNHAFDVVLMDMQMPVMDGMEATLHIRNFDTHKRNTPIFAFTADAYSEHHGKYRDAGVNDVLTKPLKWDQFQAKLNDHLSPEI